MSVELRSVSVDATRLRILQATRDLYARRGGSRGTTTREVAVRAGVNEATVFRHFGTKQTLLRAMLDEYCGHSEIPAIIATLDGPLEAQLRRLGLAAVDAMVRKVDLLKVGLAEELVSPETSVVAWDAPSRSFEALRAYFAGKVEAGEIRGEPLDLARTFLSFFFAYVIGGALWERHPDLDATPERVVDSCIDIFLNGVRPL